MNVATRSVVDIATTGATPSSSPARATGTILEEMSAAEAKAWDSLKRYKFWMFGYWAAIWVHLNRIGGFKRPNPFAEIVKLARERR